MTPPKLGFLRPEKVFWVKKSFQGSHKMKKTDFLQKPEFQDLSKSAFRLPKGYLQKCSIPLSWNNGNNYNFLLLTCDDRVNFLISCIGITQVRHQSCLEINDGNLYMWFEKCIKRLTVCCQLSGNLWSIFNFFEENI